MKLVTIATHSEGYFPFLLKSCQRFNVPLEVLGWGKKWQGYHWKILLVKEYIQGLPDDEIVCFIDAYDTILLRPVEELEDAFQKIASITKTRIIVGCEQPVNIMYTTFAHWIFGKCYDKPINSGTYIGTVKDIKTMTDDMMLLSSDPKSDDQIILRQYCTNNDGIMHIDCDNIFFLTIHNPFIDIQNKLLRVDNDVATNKPVLTYRGVQPFVLHGNGNTDMSNVIRKLNYEITKEDANKIKMMNVSRALKKILYYLQFFIALILGLAIIVFIMICVRNRARDY